MRLYQHTVPICGRIVAKKASAHFKNLFAISSLRISPFTSFTRAHFTG